MARNRHAFGKRPGWYAQAADGVAATRGEAGLIRAGGIGPGCSAGGRIDLGPICRTGVAMRDGEMRTRRTRMLDGNHEAMPIDSAREAELRSEEARVGKEGVSTGRSRRRR